ncbi:MAG: hypothetical protein HDQ96_07305 [Lachnospiraceae bacterium]|nr:hypothetical protein [Lachnospiraceae bacterium]
MPFQSLKKKISDIREKGGDRKPAVYEDFKYMLQDVNRIYIGAKYTYRELMENPEMAFKFKSVIEHYLLKETDPDTSIESDFYYMKPESFSYRTYEQLRVKCKISILTDKRGKNGKTERVYREQTVSLKELAAMPLAQKKKDGIVVQELILSKLALVSFVV